MCANVERRTKTFYVIRMLKKTSRVTMHHVVPLYAVMLIEGGLCADLRVRLSLVYSEQLRNF